MALDRDPNHVFRDFVTDRVPSSGNWKPRKPEIRQLLTEWWQTLIALVADAGGLELPNLLISMAVSGGDENNIVAEANLPVPSDPGVAVFSIVIEEPNTGPVTINGKPLLTNTGNQLAAGALATQGIYLFLDNGESYRLLSDYVSSSIVAAAEAASVQAARSAGDALGFAERAEAAATSVESPVSYAPQTLTDAEREQARANIGALSFELQALTTEQKQQVHANIGVGGRTEARIKFFKTSTMTYERIDIPGGPFTLSKHLGSGGITGSQTMRQFAQEANIDVAINCDASENYSGSLQIIEGVAYSNFGSNHTQEAVIMKRDGLLYPVYATDGKTAQDYVNEGAVWSAGHRKLLVVDGASTDLSGHVDYTAQLSARTILGQRYNGDFVIFQVEGDTGSYGITYAQAQSLCMEEGLRIAMNLDGGGSTQSWWGGSYYAHPSSDPAERPTRGYLTVNVDRTNTFDTGIVEVPVSTGVSRLDSSIPAIAVRQVGPQVFLNFTASVTLALNATVELTNHFPVRFNPETSAWLRCMLQGGNGNPVSLIATGGSPHILNARAQMVGTSYAAGGTSYASKWSGLPFK